MIGVDLEGVQLSRTGTVELLQASCPGNAYLFDVGGPLAKEVFEKGGLKDLLERPETLKVVHDCRHDADALWHLHKVRLGPVVDTQVAFAELRAVRGRARGLPTSLRTVLRKYANVTDEDIALKMAVKGEMCAQVDYWAHRPLTKDMVDYAAFDVMHLVRAMLAMKRAMVAVDKDAWKRVEADSAQYASMFKDDPDGRGPQKAARMYDDMARKCHMERMAFELQRTRELMVKKDPLRNFMFDQPLVVSALLGIPMEEAKAKGVIRVDEQQSIATVKVIVSAQRKGSEEDQADVEKQTKKLSAAIVAAYEDERARTRG